MRRTAWLLVAALVCFSGCVKRISTGWPPTRALTGPTQMARVADGYELRNRWQRVIIHAGSGDATFWGPVDGNRNLLLQPGIIARLEGELDVASDGYIEKRDDQTWQYVGQDDRGLAWRKIYCMEGESLFVTYIVQNLRQSPRTLRIVVRPNFASLRVIQNTPELFEGQNAFGSVAMQAFNVSPQSFGESSSCLLSDLHTLDPQERISFTTEWNFRRFAG